jgi:transposase
VKTKSIENERGILLNMGVFLRKVCRSKDGKSHHYWVLLESFRTARGPRHRTVAYLGEMDEGGRLGIRQVAEDSPGYQMSFLDGSVPEWVEVDVRGVHTERARRFGDVWLAVELLKRLGLDQYFRDALGQRSMKISWADVVSILVAARFCEPRSELHVAEHFYGQTALADLYGIPAFAIYDNRLYRALDQLLAHKDQIQVYLKERMGALFQVHYDLLLYDVTSTYFEGEAASNPQAQRGYSRDHRPDCKQVLIALVVAREGLPLGYEVFEGNRHDSQTVAAIVGKIERLYGQADRIWIMDRGMGSAETLRLLSRENRRYILGTPKSLLKRFEQELHAGGWNVVHSGVEVKLCRSAFGNPKEVFILCRSTARRAKEKAIHDRFLRRLEAGFRRFGKSCEEGRLRSVKPAERRLGRLLERHQRVSRFFTTAVSQKNGGVRFDWTRRKDKLDWARRSEGCYVLRSNVQDWTPEELWRAYIQLTDAEEAFRVEKDDLRLRPVWHQKQHRVQAHILVCFLAYVLWKCFGQLCRQAGLGDEPRKIIEEIKNLQLNDVVLPTRKGVDIRLRCVTMPDPELALILQKLNLEPPKRLKINPNL